MENKQEKIQEFQKKLEELQKEYGMQLYAANVVVGGENGEVVPLIKIRLQEPQMVETEEEKK